MVTDPLDNFTDREAELAAYDSMWAPGRHRVLCLDGLSGIGKSTLLDYLARRHEPRRPVAHVDLDNRRLHGGYEFVTAVAAQLRALLPGLDWRRYEVTQRRVDDERDRLLALPEVTIRQEQAARGRGDIGGSPQTATVSLDALAAELDRREALFEQRSRARLLDALCGVLGPADPFAVLVDTFETAAHAPDPRFADWFNHEFVPAFERRVPGARLVLAGREDLPGGLPSVTIRQWDRGDSDTFLAGRGLTDRGLAGAVFGHCQGHPLVTSLAADVWESGLASGKPLTPDQLRQGANQRAAVTWLMQQLYDRLPGGLGEIARVAVRLRTYQPELINHLLSGTASFDAKTEARLATLSFSEHLPGVGYRAHDLVREVEDAWFRQRPDEYRRFHATAAGYCAKAGDLAGFLYHGIAADEESAAGQWFEAVEDHRLRYRRGDVEALIGLLEAPERRPHLQPGTLGLLRFEQGLLARSRADTAPADDQTAGDRLAQAERLFGESRGFFHQDRSPWGEANTLRALGDLQVRTDRLAEAERSYAAALELYRQVEDRLGEANTLRALGDLQVRTDRLAEAERSYAAALELYRQVEDRLGEANTLQSLGRFYSIRGEDDRAEAKFAAALERFSTIGDRYSVAATLAYRGQHRTARRSPEGFADWRSALALAAAVDSYLFGQVLAIALGGTRRMLVSGEFGDHLAAALPVLIEAADGDAGQRSEALDTAFTAALSGFSVIHDLAVIKMTGPPGTEERSRLAQAASEFDQATGSAFGLAALTSEILLQADAKTASHPLAGLAADWICTPGWPESENFLAEHGELLGDDGQAVLATLAEANPADDTVALHVNLLAAARRDGVAAAYAGLRNEFAAERSAAVIREWLARAPDWAASAGYYEQHDRQLSDPAAIAALADACRREPGDAGMWLHLGLMLLGDRRRDGYSSATTGNPDPFQRAGEFLEGGDLDAALAWSGIARAADRGKGALLMAQIQLARCQFDDAAEALSDASSHIPKDQMTDVLAAYGDLIQARPGEPWRHAEYAAALERADRAAEALAAYDRAIALAPDNPSLRFNKGDLLFSLGRLDEATPELLEVTRLRPDDVLGARVLLGAIAWPADPEQAREHFASAISSPGTLLIPFIKATYRAIALAGLGRVSDAKRELETALPSQEDDDGGQDATAARILQRLQNPPLPGLDAISRLLEGGTAIGATE
jgi:tetratricopeptide (TPR) repeat protein